MAPTNSFCRCRILLYGRTPAARDWKSPTEKLCERYLSRSLARNAGKNGWSIPEATNLPNPDSAIDAVPLNDGRILLAYNDDGTIRNPLSIAVSDDPDEQGAEGSSSAGGAFRKLRDIDNELGQDFSYPSLVRARDGTFYLTYTWHYRSAIKCVHFDANWLGLNPIIVGR